MGIGAVFLSGCATVAQVTTWSDEACRRQVTDQLHSILADEGERADVAHRVAVNTTVVLSTGSLGPQRKGEDCLLRLYGRRKGFIRYTNNLIYLATRPLDACACAE